MSAKLATKPSRALLTQLESMLDEVQTPECRHWLEQELEGYSLCSHLPWYRIVACRQRGHFLDLKTGETFDLSHKQSNAKPTRPGPDSVHLCP